LYSGRQKEQIEFGECLLPFGSDSLVSLLLPKYLESKKYRITVLSAVLHKHETWSLTSRE
jgi:hypothetical protein